jgi:ABC-2 type transport system ATP-binding protein
MNCYRSSSGRAEIENWVHSNLQQWHVSHTIEQVPTSLGTTHLLHCGTGDDRFIGSQRRALGWSDGRHVRRTLLPTPAAIRVWPGGGLVARTSGVLTMPAVNLSTPPAIEAEALVKAYGEVEAVRGVSFAVARSEVFGFLGPNGAGKSTTINMLCTLVRATSGTARVGGFDVAGERDDVRRHIGLVFQDPTLDGYLTAEQNLRLHAELYGVEPEVIPERMRQMLEMVDLWDRRGTPVQTYSGGMRRRLEIARGLMHSPRVLFLDEPTIGLDPQTRSSIWRYIRALQEAEGTTIFMTTHYMDEAELCDRIAIMDRGEIVVLDTPEALKASVGADRVVLGTTDDEAALAALHDRFGIEAAVAEGAVTFHVASGEAFVPRLFAELGVGITSVTVARPTLDDVFMRYTGSTIRDAETGSPADRDRAMMRAMARSGR